LPIPNNPNVAHALVRSTDPAGVLLTGGGEIGALGGADSDRDKTEARLISWARENKKPVLGICRGMQVLQALFGVSLVPVDGHIATHHDVAMDGQGFNVNSFHGFGARTTVPALEVWARSDDDVIEAIRHLDEPIFGIMWHPEREEPHYEGDFHLFNFVFNVKELG